DRDIKQRHLKSWIHAQKEIDPENKKPPSANGRWRGFEGANIRRAQPVNIAQHASISGNIAGVENHHCTKLEKKSQIVPDQMITAFLIPICLSNHAVARNRPKILQHQ